MYVRLSRRESAGGWSIGMGPPQRGQYAGQSGSVCGRIGSRGWWVWIGMLLLATYHTSPPQAVKREAGRPADMFQAAACPSLVVPVRLVS